MSEQATADRASSLLDGMRTSLRADGYGIQVEGTDSGIHVTVSADSESCSDCLVPVDVFRGIVSTILEKGGLSVDSIEVTYPKVTH